MGKLTYLGRSLSLLLDGERLACPNCGGNGHLVARKFVVTALRRCHGCKLLYRTPTETPEEAAQFYNNQYVQGNTTQVPSLEELERMKENDFVDLESDYTKFTKTLYDLGVASGSKVFDYGCSWGYGSYLFKEAGFRVKSFEISLQRRSFGREHLGVDLTENFEDFVSDAQSTFDVFFSSHVLEHVPAPSRIIELGYDLLKPGGLFVSLVPNGSAAYRQVEPKAWRQLWGEVHPNFLDDEYVESVFAGSPYVIGVSPVEITDGVLHHLQVNRGGLRLNDLVGYELFFAARKPL